jgi:hypothetical protein
VCSWPARYAESRLWNRIEQLHRVQVRRDDAGRIAEAHVEIGADERAVVVQRHRRHIVVVLLPGVALKEILFDVRRIEIVDRRAVLAQIAADRAHRFLPSEVADDGHEQVVALEVAQILKFSSVDT